MGLIEMNNYVRHAMQEFRAAGWINENDKFKDEMQEMICNHILKLLEVFYDEGHSGSSAPYTVNLFEKLAKFEPIVPLTGEDWEWSEVGEGIFQNKRCSHVFKQIDRFDGRPYDVDGIVFWEWYTDEKTGEKSKLYFSNGDSFIPITFPYTPKREYKERI